MAAAALAAWLAACAEPPPPVLDPPEPRAEAAPLAPPLPVNCRRHSEMVGILAGRYGERRVAARVLEDGNLAELYANRETTTWSAVVVTTDRIACMVASGRGWKPPAETTT